MIKLEEEIAALKARIAELEKLVPKPPEEFTPRPWRRYDPTENASMDPQTMKELADAMPPLNGAAEARALSAVAVGRQPIAPSGKDPSQRILGSGRGWVEPNELPSFGQSAADRMIDKAVGGEGK
jgi:hypothetical protein